MRVGTIAYACDSGLGNLARSFYQHGVITDVLVVRHPSHPTHDEWYPGAPQTVIRPFNRTLALQFCASMDVMLFLETPFDWTLIDYCRSLGVKTVLSVMHECTPERLPAVPDLFLCPSELDYQCFKDLVPVRDNTANCYFLPVPVEVPWRQRSKAEVFVHNAGHGGLRGRNGTAELLESLPLVKSPVRLIIRSQGPIRSRLAFNHTIDWHKSATVRVGNVTVDYRLGTTPMETLWDEGDVFVFPEKFNGLSLPLQEARAAGMLVMGADRYPMNCWLPSGPLIPVQGYQRARVGPPYIEYDEALIDPQDIAARIDEWYGADITEYSQAGKEWAESMSWPALLPRYRAVLEGLLAGQ